MSEQENNRKTTGKHKNIFKKKKRKRKNKKEL